VFTPDPVPQPGSGTGELPPPTPTAPGPLFPEPVTETEPFIPKPGLTPPPGTSTDAPEKPADVPEPGSFWLGGIGLAALCLLRRRPGTVKRES
jgi:MYXO-CTERM domain-containing protein